MISIPNESIPIFMKTFFLFLSIILPILALVTIVLGIFHFKNPHIINLGILFIVAYPIFHFLGKKKKKVENNKRDMETN
ncbi:hypothetical protein EV194_105101 [Natronoflexus pectinivorans]|uniref:Uncharacterized protein n=1 Tax=Natronoflexus pectinivorans TaxID=682526 RepID=A0A4R2GIB5_9BACT|nr:hypothetical protein EV194_105101 [Natronoflexus pectinivorans]